jgi:phosphoglucosamine mutase
VSAAAAGLPPARLFGTDGIRARAGAPPLDRQTVTALGARLAELLAERLPAGGPPPAVVLGGDTRASTAEICAWLAAGLGAGGAGDAVVRYAGVIPTPGVAYLARRLGAAAGVVVSASHNPNPDNGIKLLDGSGLKWSEAAEQELELRLRLPGAAITGPAAVPVPEAALRESYLSHLVASVPALAAAGSAARHGDGGDDGGGRPPLAGLRLVADAANGAASGYAAELFARLGAAATVLCAAPDGRNVNLECGSTAPAAAAAAVVATGADLGVAFDGDADRCILIDERGAVRDGDAVLYLWATRLHAAGRLTPAAIVATEMSNLGLERALARHGIAVVRCGVGDRQVVETMRRRGILLGGEQSGHIVHSELSATGDGLLTAAQVAALVHAAGRPLSALLAGFRRYPQTLVNVQVASKPDLSTLPRVVAAAQAVAEALGADGRLLLRYSGTEPLARVMIEGPDQETIEALAGQLAGVLAGELGAPAG